MLRTIRCPVLVVAGDRDDIKLEHTLLIYRSIAQASLWILPRTGHATFGLRPSVDESDARVVFKRALRRPNRTDRPRHSFLVALTNARRAGRSSRVRAVVSVRSAPESCCGARAFHRFSFASPLLAASSDAGSSVVPRKSPIVCQLFNWRKVYCRTLRR